MRRPNTELTPGFIVELKSGRKFYVREDNISWPAKNGRPTYDVGISTTEQLEHILAQASEFHVRAYDTLGNVGEVCRTFKRADIANIHHASYPTAAPVVELRRDLLARIKEYFPVYRPSEAHSQ